MRPQLESSPKYDLDFLKHSSWIKTLDLQYKEKKASGNILEGLDLCTIKGVPQNLPLAFSRRSIVDSIEGL
nr:hypothetical protein BgiMline_019749 [Biomphalaria glabrata]